MKANRVFFAVLLVAAWGVRTAGGAEGPAATGGIAPPFVRVPKLSTPPVIDAELNLADWRGSAGVCGMVSVEGTYLGQDFDAAWRLGYDDQNLYLACLCIAPKDTAFLGTFSRGLWWYAEWDRGWITDDRQPLVQLVRRAGAVEARFRFVNTPCVLDRPREIEFVLQAAPVKPLPADARHIAWKYPERLFAHDTSGNRYYGKSLDTFTLYTDEEFEALRRFYYEKPIATGFYGMAWLEPARQGRPLVEYGSTWCMGIGRLLQNPHAAREDARPPWVSAPACLIVGGRASSRAVSFREFCKRLSGSRNTPCSRASGVWARPTGPATSSCVARGTRTTGEPAPGRRTRR